MNYQLPGQWSAYLSLADEKLQSYFSSGLEHAQRYLAFAWNRLPEIAPYLPLIVTTAAALLSLMLFLSMRAQLRSVQARLRKFEEAATPGTEPVKSELKEEPAILMTLPKAGLDTTTRSKVLRMHRAGQSSDDIAASLRMPRGEVDLLVKVHEIELGSLGEPASA